MWDEACAHPVLFGVYLVWAITAGMNAMMGHTIGGGGLGGLALGAVFVSIAYLGAYAADAQQHQTGTVRLCMWIMVACQLCIGQMAGWQTLGLTLDRGAEKLSAEAASRGVDKDLLQSKRAELKQIGIVRPIAAIQAAEKLECARRSARYPDGVGPECTKLRAELASAKRARTLEGEVAELAVKMESGSGVGHANAGTAVPEVLASHIGSFVTGRSVKVTGEDVLFALHVFLVAVLEYVGILGKWLFGPPRAEEHVASFRGAADSPLRGAGDSPAGSRPPARSAHHMFDPRMLPPAWTMQHPQIRTAANDGSDPATAHAGGAVNVINVGPGVAPPALLPPRIAARRRGG
jgi:hypothetical protein